MNNADSTKMSRIGPQIVKNLESALQTLERSGAGNSESANQIRESIALLHEVNIVYDPELEALKAETRQEMLDLRAARESGTLEYEFESPFASDEEEAQALEDFIAQREAEEEEINGIPHEEVMEMMIEDMARYKQQELARAKGN